MYGGKRVRARIRGMHFPGQIGERSHGDVTAILEAKIHGKCDFAWIRTDRRADEWFGVASP